MSQSRISPSQVAPQKQGHHHPQPHLQDLRLAELVPVVGVGMRMAMGMEMGMGMGMEMEMELAVEVLAMAPPLTHCLTVPRPC